MVESKSSGVSGLFDGLEKTTNDIINKFTSLQLILIKKQGGLYPHETFEKEVWIKKSDAVARINEVLQEIDKKFTELWNARLEVIQDPDMCKVIEVEKKGYYPAKQIDALDNKLWLEWIKIIDEVFSQQTVRQGSRDSSLSQEGEE